MCANTDTYLKMPIYCPNVTSVNFFEGVCCTVRNKLIIIKIFKYKACFYVRLCYFPVCNVKCEYVWALCSLNTKPFAECCCFFEKSANLGKVQRSSKIGKKTLGSLFPEYFEIMNSWFMFVAHSDPEFLFHFLRRHEAKTQRANEELVLKEAEFFAL